jgi:hypothetical protein
LQQALRGHFCFLVSFPLKDAKFSLPEAVNLLADLKIKLS